MSNEQQPIFEDSQDAASVNTVTGWVSRDGFFWGRDERAARWAGATHRRCEKHNAVYPKNSYCGQCSDEKEVAIYAVLPRAPWKGNDPLYDEAGDKWFWSLSELADEVGDMAAELEVDPATVLSAMRLRHTKPQHAEQIDPVDHYQDILPEDADDVPKELAEAFERLNAVIRECKTPLSWWPDDVAAVVTLADLGLIDEPAQATPHD